jgi:hypothetical protein
MIQNMVSDGRKNETEVPASDQFPNYPDPSGSYKPYKYNQKAILKGVNKGPVSKFVIEELYQGKEWQICPNVHTATFENGRHVYQFPSSFRDSRTQNKAIALRRIDTPANPYAFTLNFVIMGITPEGNKTIDVSVCIPPRYTIEEALSAILVEHRKRVAKIYASALADTVPQLHLVYSEPEHTVRMSVSRANNDPLNWILLWSDGSADFYKLVNSTITYIFDQTYDQDTVLTFNNVWNRRHLFLSASFVPRSGFLGRGGEFHNVLSKYYKDVDEQFFYIEVSFDGFRKVSLPYENFLLELSFVLDYNDYLF